MEIESTSNNHDKNEHFLIQLDEDLDFALALSLQSEFNYEAKENAQNNKYVQEINPHFSQGSSKPLSIVDKQWELIDPHPDIHSLFMEFNKKFFDGVLEGVEVRWSPRMTLCAGVCCYEGRGGLCSVRLSMPLLKLRPRRDLVETLLHEMIHALLFVTQNNKDHDGHGPEFLKHMHRINKETGTRISVYHSFHDEVDLYRTHWWKCNGPCQKKSPFFGIVKRAMNRAPGPRDPWWSQHQATCGGSFLKIKEPDNFKKPKVGKRKASLKDSFNDSGHDIRNFFKPNSSKLGSDTHVAKKAKYSNVHTLSSPAIEQTISSTSTNITNVHTISTQSNAKINVTPFSGSGHKLGSSDKNRQSLGSPVKDFSVFRGKNFLDSTNLRIPGLYELSNDAKTSTKGNITRETTVFSGQRKTNSNNSNSDKRKPISPSEGRCDKFVQSPIDEFFKKSPLLDSSKTNNLRIPNTCILSDTDSDDSFVIGSPLKNEFVICDSPRTADPSSTDLCNASGDGFEIPNVNCPACGTAVKNCEINNHLDMCLIEMP